nr:hypothetical protein [Ferrimicrobium acidiphilum]
MNVIDAGAAAEWEVPLYITVHIGPPIIPVSVNVVVHVVEWVNVTATVEPGVAVPEDGEGI